MLVKLNNNCFIRIYNNQGYIVNQNTKKESVFDETGADFLKNIDRNYKHVDTIIHNLSKEYGLEHLLDIRADFNGFIQELEKDNYLSIVNQNFNRGINFENDVLYKNYEFEQQLTRVHLEVTKMCNERCVHCYIPNKEKNNSKLISYDNAVEYINQIVDTGALWINFTGGEPFLHPKLSDILFYTRKKDLIITLSSNLVLLSDYLLSVLKEINPQVIEVSLYSLQKEIHDNITNLKGSHEKTLNNVYKLLENNIKVEVNCPIMRNNFNEFDLLKEWGVKNDIDIKYEISLAAQYDFNSNNLKNSIDDNDLNKFLLSNNLQNKAVDINEKTRHLNESPCSAGQNILYISVDGLVYPCSSFQSLSLGSLKESDLIDIWNNSPNLRKIRDVIRRDFFNYENQDYFDFMNICMARNANINKGDYLKLDPNSVKIAQHIKKNIDKL